MAFAKARRVDLAAAPARYERHDPSARRSTRVVAGAPSRAADEDWFRVRGKESVVARGLHAFAFNTGCTPQNLSPFLDCAEPFRRSQRRTRVDAVSAL